MLTHHFASATPFARALKFLPCLVAVSFLSGCVIMTSTERREARAEAALSTVNPADPLLKERKVMLTTDVNELSARQIVQSLLYLDTVNHESINLYLDTSGGAVQHCFAIIDGINALHSKVNTYAIGNCNSAGAMILACGTGRRYAWPHATIAIHGDVRIGRVPRSYTTIVRRQIDALWKRHARLPADWYPLSGGVTHFLTAEEALKYGVIDAIAEPPPKSP